MSIPVSLEPSRRRKRIYSIDVNGVEVVEQDDTAVPRSSSVDSSLAASSALPSKETLNFSVVHNELKRRRLAREKLKERSDSSASIAAGSETEAGNANADEKAEARIGDGGDADKPMDSIGDEDWQSITMRLGAAAHEAEVMHHVCQMLADGNVLAGDYVQRPTMRDEVRSQRLAISAESRRSELMQTATLLHAYSVEKRTNIGRNRRFFADALALSRRRWMLQSPDDTRVARSTRVRVAFVAHVPEFSPPSGRFAMSAERATLMAASDGHVSVLFGPHRYIQMAQCIALLCNGRVLATLRPPIVDEAAVKASSGEPLRCGVAYCDAMLTRARLSAYLIMFMSSLVNAARSVASCEARVDARDTAVFLTVRAGAHADDGDALRSPAGDVVLQFRLMGADDVDGVLRSQKERVCVRASALLPPRLVELVVRSVAFHARRHTGLDLVTAVHDTFACVCDSAQHLSARVSSTKPWAWKSDSSFRWLPGDCGADVEDLESECDTTPLTLLRFADTQYRRILERTYTPTFVELLIALNEHLRARQLISIGFASHTLRWLRTESILNDTFCIESAQSVGEEDDGGDEGAAQQVTRVTVVCGRVRWCSSHCLTRPDAFEIGDLVRLLGIK